MATREIPVPDIGDFKNIPVIEIFVKPGDVVAKDAALVTLCLLYTSPSPRD